eukprot:gene21487-27522_t
MAMAGADFAAEMGWVLATPAAEIGATWTGSVFAPVGQPAVDLDALRGRLATAVDDRIAGIYLRWTRFETEYTEREAAARAYVAAEYQGECSPWVTSFAEPAGLTLAAAADRIVEQADSLRTALGLLGALRMRKYGIEAADVGVQPRTLQDLATHELVHYVSTLGTRSAGFEVQEGAATRFLPMGGRVTVNSAEAYLGACLAGLGLIQVPLLGAQDLVEQGLLVPVLAQHPPPPMPVTLLYAHRRHLPQRVRVVMDWLAAVVQTKLD